MINISASVKKAIVELVQQTTFLIVASLSPEGFKKKDEKYRNTAKVNWNLTCWGNILRILLHKKMK